MKKEFESPIIETKELSTGVIMGFFDGSTDNTMTNSWTDEDVAEDYKIWKGLK